VLSLLIIVVLIVAIFAFDIGSRCWREN